MPESRNTKQDFQRNVHLIPYVPAISNEQKQQKISSNSVKIKSKKWTILYCMFTLAHWLSTFVTVFFEVWTTTICTIFMNTLLITRLSVITLHFYYTSMKIKITSNNNTITSEIVWIEDLNESLGIRAAKFIFSVIYYDNKHRFTISTRN